MKNIKMILGSLLISACVMSAHAGEKTVTIGSDGILETKTVLTLNPGTTFQVNEGKTLHNYGTISCSNGEDTAFSGTGTIVNYNHIMEEADSFTDYSVASSTKYYLPTGAGKIAGNYDAGEVTVSAAAADVNVFFRDNSEDNLATTTLVLAHTCDSENAMTLTRSDAASIILANLANELPTTGAEGKKSHSLQICGNGTTKISGNQTKFTAGTLTCNGGTTVLAGGQNGMFPVPITVNNSGSLLIWSDSGTLPINITQNITVDGGASSLTLMENSDNNASSTFNINANLTFINGAKFISDSKAPFVLKKGHSITFSAS
ncbi:MAG: hypothetical protein IJ599_02170 [Alphaproteobacteria bacterium]|nr:hypothetical protein [Alphaproteobacteria bacterium]